MPLEALGGARRRPKPRSRAAPKRHGIIDDSSANGDEWRFPAEDETVAGTRDHWLVENETGGGGCARPQHPPNRNDPSADVRSPQMQAEAGSRTDRPARAREHFDVREDDGRSSPGPVADQDLSAPQLRDLGARQGDRRPHARDGGGNRCPVRLETANAHVPS
jgi:hypothetical protein